MHAAHHGLYKRKNTSVTARFRHFINSAVYVAALFGVVSNIPQLIQVWVNASISGVSLVSWVGFLCLSFFWCIYGITNKELPIVVANTALIIIQSLIVLGVVMRTAFSFPSFW